MLRRLVVFGLLLASPLALLAGCPARRAEVAASAASCVHVGQPCGGGDDQVCCPGLECRWDEGWQKNHCAWPYVPPSPSPTSTPQREEESEIWRKTIFYPCMEVMSWCARYEVALELVRYYQEFPGEVARLKQINQEDEAAAIGNEMVLTIVDLKTLAHRMKKPDPWCVTDCAARMDAMRKRQAEGVPPERFLFGPRPTPVP
jgi:hypothetical protein